MLIIVNNIMVLIWLIIDEGDFDGDKIMDKNLVHGDGSFSMDILKDYCGKPHKWTIMVHGDSW